MIRSASPLSDAGQVLVDFARLDYLPESLLVCAAPTLERGQLAAPRSPADPVVSVENPAGDTILDYSKPGGVEVTAGTVTRHRSGETVIDFSRTGARAAAPDLLTGDGVEESKAP